MSHFLSRTFFEIYQVITRDASLEYEYAVNARFTQGLL